MTEFNFSQLQSLKTPDSWMEAALNIPQKKHKPFFFSRPAFIGTAASVFIAAAVVLTIFLHTGSNGSPLKPSVALPVQPTTVAAGGTVSPVETMTESGISGGEIPASAAVTKPSEPVAVTNASGDVIATHAAFITSPTAANAVTEQTTGESAAPSGEQPLTTVSVETTTEFTQPLTEELRTTEPCEEEDTEPCTETPTQASTQTLTEPTVVSEDFNGSLLLYVTQDSPLFSSTYVRVELDDSNGKPCGGTVTLRPKLSGAGYKFAVFQPQNENILLALRETYTLRAYNTNGVSQRVSFTVSVTDNLRIYLS